MKRFDKNPAYDCALLALLAIAGNRLGFPLSIVPSYRKAVAGGDTPHLGGLVAIVESREDFMSAIIARNDNRGGKRGRPIGTTKGYGDATYSGGSFGSFGSHDDTGHNVGAMLPILATLKTDCKRTDSIGCNCAECSERIAKLVAKYADCAEHYASGKQSEYVGYDS